MKDLVEYVIDGILQKEQMQQQKPAADPEAGAKFREVMANIPVQKQLPEHAQLHAVGSQMPESSQTRDPELWKVSRQFEAIFIQQMMAEMRKTVGKSDFMPSGFAEDVHASMMDEAIARASSTRGSFGIAESIYRQLEAARSKAKQPVSTQEISTTADKLQMRSDLAMEVSRHAH